jgi:hypothetical protein
MRQRLLNEINEIKYMFTYTKGKVISEQINNNEITEDDYISSPYVLSATPDGDVKIINNTTKQIYVYSISAYGVGVDVKDFPEGDSIKVSIPLKGVETFELPSGGEASNTIKNNVGKEKILVNVEGVTITLKCQSGCVKTQTKSNTEKVTKTVSDTTKNAANAAKSFLGF